MFIGGARRTVHVLGALAAAGGLVFLLAGCSEADIERRAREAAEKVQESIPDVHAVALAQKTTAEDIRQAQQALTALKEYQGEINGELDEVTVNAIQAFQRSHDMKDDGILDAATVQRLRGAIAKK